MTTDDLSPIPPDTPRRERRPDRRVLKTRTAIREAFRRLVREHGLDKLTVSMLSREADINRKTFYLHYESIEALIDDEVSEVVSRLFECAEAVRGLEPRAQVRAVLDEVDAIVSADLELYRYVAASLSLDYTLDHLARAVARLCENLPADARPPMDEAAAYRLRFYLAGAGAAYAAWLQSDRATPLAQMSDWLVDPLASGLSDMLAAQGQE